MPEGSWQVCEHPAAHGLHLQEALRRTTVFEGHRDAIEWLLLACANCQMC